MRILVLDCETTGLDPDIDIILELGWLIFDYERNEVVKCVESHLCYTDTVIPYEASAVHHIINSDLQDADSITQVLDRLSTDCKNFNVKAVCAHNLQFDASFILKAVTVQSNLLNLSGICTLRLARKLFPDITSHQLQVLRYALHLDTFDVRKAKMHRTDGDVLLLAELLHRIIEEVEFDSLAEFIEAADKPFIMKRMPFGKYRKEEIASIYRNTPSYIEWLASLKELDSDLRFTVNHYLGIPN